VAIIDKLLGSSVKNAVTYSHGCRKDFFQGGALGYFSKIFRRGAGEKWINLFFPLETKKTTFFAEFFKIRVGQCPPCPSPFQRPFLQCFLSHRITETLELTGTLKQRKVNLQKEGFDIKKISDKIFFLDSGAKNYIPVTEELQKGLEDGSIRI